MTIDQALLFLLIAAVLGLLLWGKYRHDLVAVGGLLLGVIVGVVPEREAFSGFANHAVIIVALVLVASRAIENSGALAFVARAIGGKGRGVPAHIVIFGGIGAGLSGLINNVAALAILMPLDVQAARKAKRGPGRTLMALAFATILGGMVTLIGTPSNIVAAAVRAEQLGAPYGMFDFTPVGLAVALAGLAFVALIGWRLVPDREDRAAKFIREALFEAELEVPEESAVTGKTVLEVSGMAENAEVELLGLLRNGTRYFSERRPYGFQVLVLQPGDVLIVRGTTDTIAEFIKTAGLQQPEEAETEDETEAGKGAGKAKAEHKKGGAAEGADVKEEEEEAETPPRPMIIEAVTRADSWLIGRTARSMGLSDLYGITLLGIGRGETVNRKQVRNRRIEAGDVLLLSTWNPDIGQVLDLLGLIPVDEVSIQAVKPRDAIIATGIFSLAVAVAAAGLLSFTVSIAAAVALYGALGLVPARDFYTHIDWSVVVMLACLLPIGTAFQEVGGTALVSQGIADLTQGTPPVVALIAVMVVTMTLSDALNNVATMIITGPIAIDLAGRVGANPDTFLMGSAVAASCAFLTPIGHKNNTLIMGPGGFRFADYWRMGLPLELVVLMVAVPMLVWVWGI